MQLKERHPNALVLAHPECTEAVLRHADYIGSTTGILNYATHNPATEFIVATESGILHQMKKHALKRHSFPLLAKAVAHAASALT